MSAADFDVKLKLIILVTLALVTLLAIGGYLIHRDHHFSKFLLGSTGVVVVLGAILITLLVLPA